MTQDERIADINKRLNEFDAERHQERVVWRANAPKCDCEHCPKYKNWLEWGRGLYNDNMDAYKERVNQEEVRREHRRASRLIG